jgi:hypothetical protein
VIVNLGTTITRIGHVRRGDLIFNEGLTAAYIDTDTANVITAPSSSAVPVQPGSSIPWAGRDGLLYGRDPTGGHPGVGITRDAGVPLPAPINAGPNLTIPQLQSPNFLTGVSGWTIRKDGSAEFNTLNLRGTFSGTDFIINSNGAFFYNGTPALGNLAFSIAPASGVDSFGNAYISGIAAYDTVTGSSIQIRSNTIFMANPNDFSPATIALASVITGFDGMTLHSPAINSTDVQAFLSLVRGPAGGNGLVQISNAALNLKTSVSPSAPANGTSLYVDTAGQPNYINQNGLAVGLSGAPLADTSSITVTQAAATDITAVWTIPANDMEVGAVYKLTTMGNGTWGSTAQVLNFQGKLGGTAFLTPQWGAGTFPVNQAFRWKTEITLICTATGAGGTFFAEMTAYISVNNTTWLPQGTNANGTGAGTVSGTGNAVDTTAAHNLSIQAFWASTTGGPTLTSHGSVFQRIA